MSPKQSLNTEVTKKLSSEMGVNIMSLPQVEKVAVSVGLGQHKESKEITEFIEKELMSITGQKPKKTSAKKSIAGFKIREGQHIGFLVTLRGKRMWQFMEKLTSVVLPRVRDFEGIGEKSIDGSGNLNFAIKEHLVFPEIKPDEIKGSWGMTITLTLDKKTDPELARKYYKELGFVFMKG